MKRIINAFEWFYASLVNPKTFNIAYFKLVEGMMKFLEETAKHGAPMGCQLRITKLAEVLYEDGKDNPFLHLWCGVNEMDNPIKRVMQLAEENRKLRGEIAKLKTPDL